MVFSVQTEQQYEATDPQRALYLNQQGDFAWIPATHTCADPEKTKAILDLIGRMPENRRAVWTPRLDIEETIARCPIIQQNADLNKKFTELLSAYNTSKQTKLNPQESTQGGEQPNEQ